LAINDLKLVAAFVESANVSELRQALKLPAHLGKLEAEFVLAAGRVFERLGKGTSPGHHAGIGGFARTWVESFNEELRECRRVVDAALAD
jgi:hypothetical protein